MVQLLQPQQVKVVTKDGECKISLTIDLNINLNQVGDFIKQGIIKKENEPDDDEVNFAIPDFGSGAKVNFGKQEEAR